MAWLIALVLILGHGLPSSTGQDSFSGLIGPGDICSVAGMDQSVPGHGDHDDCALHCAPAFIAGPPGTSPVITIAWAVSRLPGAPHPDDEPLLAAPVSQHSPRGPPILHEFA